LKYTYWGIFVVLIIVAAMMCGCTSGPATGGPTGNVTASPTVTPGMSRSGSLFDIDRLQWFEYRLTTPGEGGKTTTSDLRFDYTTATVNGVEVRDDRITMKMSDPDIVLTMDSYYDMATDKQIGGHMKMVSDDVTLTDQDVAAADDQYQSSDVAGTFSTSDWPVTGLGTETITVGDKAYTCTKYSVGNAGEYGTAWVAQGVPVPVRIESKSAAEGTSTWELLGWG
jgi:hypothetical protein